MLEALHARRAASIETRAHHAATSPRNDKPEPTEAQRRAGNYALGHVTVQGLRVSIENPAGSVRSGTDVNGRIWRTTLQHHYGYLKGSEGADGDHVDCFIGPHPESELVFVIDQVNADGCFDEHKCVLGARSAAEARAIYLSNYQAGWTGLGAMTALPIGEFKHWLEHHDTTVPMAPNRLPAALLFTKAQLDPQGRITLKADVQNPGSRGGVFYIDHAGRIRYGTPPIPERVFHGASSVTQRATVTSKKSGLFAGRVVSGPADTAEVFREIVDHDRERFWMLHLSKTGRAVAVECISQGSLSASIVHPRETFKNAIALGTTCVALVHNHPSGHASQSHEDWEVTKRLLAVADYIGIEVAHHVVVGAEGYSEVSGYPGPAMAWSAPSTGARKQLRQVEGRLERSTPPQGPNIFGRAVTGSDVAASIGRVLLDPQDRIAVALLTDTKHRILGVYPLAHERIDVDQFATQVMKLAVGTSASALVIVAGKDGPTWQASIAAVDQEARRLVDLAGVRYLDTVSVGDTEHRSSSDNDRLVW